MAILRELPPPQEDASRSSRQDNPTASLAEKEYGPWRPTPAEEDALLERMFTEGKGRDWQPLSEDNWEEELQKVPLFMNRLPSKKRNAEAGEEAAVEEDANPALEALQTMIYEGTPEEIATNFKNQGNEIVQERCPAKYPHALRYYTQALEQRCGVDALECTVLINRAMVHLLLENYRSALRDCERALKREIPTVSLRVKAMYRLVKARLGLRHEQEAQQALHDLREYLESQLAAHPELQPERTRIQQLHQELTQLQQEHHAERQRQLLRKQRWESLQMAVRDAIQARKLKLIPAEHPAAPSQKFTLPLDFGYRVQVQAGGMAWPVILIYPHLCGGDGYFDVVQSWEEDVKVSTMLQHVWEGRDEVFMQSCPDGFQYTRNTVAVYQRVPQPSSGGWKRVRVLATLAEAMCGVVDQDLVVRLWVVPKAEGSRESNQWTRTWLQQ